MECDYSHRRLSVSGLSSRDGHAESDRYRSGSGRRGGSNSGRGNNEEVEGGTSERDASSELGVAGDTMSSTGGGGGTAEYFLCDVGSTNGTYVQVRCVCESGYVVSWSCTVCHFLFVSV